MIHSGFFLMVQMNAFLLIVSGLYKLFSIANRKFIKKAEIIVRCGPWCALRVETRSTFHCLTGGGLAETASSTQTCFISYET
jgi:hypothetical protein